MNIEICFLNKKGGLSCLMNESFFSIEQAERYVRSVLRGPMGENIARVELSQVRRDMAARTEPSACDMAFSLPMGDSR
jgi:hypothetical protein